MNGKTIKEYFKEILTKKERKNNIKYFRNIESVDTISSLITSFANTNGGCIIFGVNTENSMFNVEGISNDIFLEERLLDIKSSLDENLYYVVDQLLYDNREVLCMYIFKSYMPILIDNKRYILNENGEIEIKAPSIFISHSSKDKKYGDILVELLRDIGIKKDQIVYTSDDIYGIPIGENIFNYLKTIINDDAYIIYFLSDNYYESIPSLNEMGAAWMIKNYYDVIGVPGFSFSNSKFKEGSIDSMKIGFLLNNRQRLMEFTNKLIERFNLEKVDHAEMERIIQKVTNKLES